jgi:WD40 repeat protein
MNKHHLLLVVMLHLWLITPVSHAQEATFLPDDLEPITSENISRIQEVARFSLPDDWVRAIAFSSDGTLLAAGTWFDSVHVWRVSTGDEVATQPVEIPLCDIRFSPDSTRLASSDLEGDMYLWDFAADAETTVLAGPQRSHHNICGEATFSPDSALLAYASEDGAIRLWDVAASMELITIRTQEADRVLFSPDGKLLAASDTDGTIRLWDVAARTETAILEGHSELISSMAFSPNGGLLASGSLDFTVKLWDLEADEVINTIASDDQAYFGIANLAFSPDGTSIVFSGAYSITVWDVTQWQEKAYLRHGLAVNAAFNPDGSLIAFGTLGGTVRVWNYATNEDWVLEGHTDWVNDVEFSPNGLLLASCSEDGSIRLWGVPSEE